MSSYKFIKILLSTAVLSVVAYGSCSDLARAYPSVVKGCSGNKLMWRGGGAVKYDDGRKKSFNQALNTSRCFEHSVQWELHPTNVDDDIPIIWIFWCVVFLLTINTSRWFEYSVQWELPPTNGNHGIPIIWIFWCVEHLLTIHTSRCVEHLVQWELHPTDVDDDIPII